MLIAVDFDGTIVEHRYPKIGKEIPFAFATLRKLQSEGHQLILWSVREGRLLQEALDYCAANGVEFYAVNSNYPDEDTDLDALRTRKLRADVFIDDRNIGGLPDWGIIYQMITNHWSFREYMENVHNIPAKKSVWQKIFG